MSKLATFIELYLSCLKTEECKSLLQIIWCCELKNYYGTTLCNASNDFELSNLSEEDIKKSCLTLITVKPLEKTKFLKDGAEVLTLSLRNIYKKLLINLLTFYEECKIAKLKSVFKGGTRTS